MTPDDLLGFKYSSWRSLSLEQCQQQLRRQNLSTGDRFQLCYRLGNLLVQQGDLKGAIAYYQQAIDLSPQPPADLWIEQGHAYRGLGQYRQALRCYDQGLAIAPDDLQALTGKGGVLAVLGQKRAAKKMCQQALDRYPTAAEAWHGMGVVLSVSGRNQAALSYFEKALALNPDFDRARCNRGIVLTRLGRWGEAIASFDAALDRGAQRPLAWHGSALAYRGFALMRLGRYQEAIASCDRALAIQPRSYPAALARLISLVMTGQLSQQLTQRESRRSLLANVGTVLGGLKWRFLGLLGAITLLRYGQGGWADALRAGLPWLLSVGIVALVAADVWKHRDRLSFVWQTYCTSPLTYLRAFATVLVTLTTYTIADSIAPPFMRWGWANWVFGQPGNVIFQPFHLIEKSTASAPLPSSEMLTSPSVTSLAAPPPPVETAASVGLSSATALILLFWALLMFGIPFWARLEERIFRKGANTWRQIAVRSTQFGLVHLLAGIPIVGGLVLILPGFLFACRYKFVRDRHFKRTRDAAAAQEAGLTASTQDHAVYNAILITMAVAALLML
ncbi:MAG TPA: tetratricopeptide repeat protein [Synechococcales cyanobacterium M55_K2018_004]|nr:tetratricopeptide repeat protein [Synechococcales cyanobacterium M55_K2018_004]